MSRSLQTLHKSSVSYAHVMYIVLHKNLCSFRTKFIIYNLKLQKIVIKTMMLCHICLDYWKRCMQNRVVVATDPPFIFCLNLNPSGLTDAIAQLFMLL